jgi:DNA-binding NarL/FixJ family response regulator
VGRRLRVFVVEDSPIIRGRILDNLSALGYFEVVGYAESADEAVEGIRNLRPDVIITDIRLKEGNGIQVVRQVRADDVLPRPTVFVLTNYDYPEYRDQCSAAGADAFFDKSAEYDLLLSNLQRLGLRSPKAHSPSVG